MVDFVGDVDDVGDNDGGDDDNNDGGGDADTAAAHVTRRPSPGRRELPASTRNCCGEQHDQIARQQKNRWMTTWGRQIKSPHPEIRILTTAHRGWCRPYHSAEAISIRSDRRGNIFLSVIDHLHAKCEVDTTIDDRRRSWQHQAGFAEATHSCI